MSNEAHERDDYATAEAKLAFQVIGGCIIAGLLVVLAFLAGVGAIIKWVIS